MDETKVQIGEEVLLDIGIHSEWYISSTGYDGESVDIKLRKKADRIQKWWFSEEYSSDGKPCGLTLQSSDGNAVDLVPAQKWIPCSERMPEPGSWAIWCSYRGMRQIARWKEDAIDHFFPDQGFFQLEDAVAWMPLPEPYKGADDEADRCG